MGCRGQAGCAVDDIITAINSKPMLNSTINQVGLDIKYAGGSLTMYGCGHVDIIVDQISRA